MPVGTNEKLRESRLFGSMSTYVRRNFVALFRIYTAYEPLRVFTRARAAPRGARRSSRGRPFLWDWIVNGDRDGHLQSVILGGVLLMAGRAALRARRAGRPHRRRTGSVSQRTLERVRRLELGSGVRRRTTCRPGTAGAAARPAGSTPAEPAGPTPVPAPGEVLPRRGRDLVVATVSTPTD